MNSSFNRKVIISSIILIALLIFSVLIYYYYSRNQDIVRGSRGTLPYYDYVYSVLGHENEIGTLEDEYSPAQGAFIVKITSAPLLGRRAVASFSSSSIHFYTMQAEVIEIVDNRSLKKADYSTITLLQRTWESLTDPFDPLYQHYIIDPEQEYLVFVYYDEERDVFEYSDRAIYFVKDNQVFSTYNIPSIDSFSGMSIGEFTGILRMMKPFNPE